MSVEVFRDRDDDYLTWVEAHSAGYVINVGRSLSGVAKLHHAACRTIISRPPFTESYIKICSAALRDFDDWVLGYPGVDLSSCGTCQPPAYNASTEDSVPAQQVLSAPEAAEAELKSTATYEWEIDDPGPASGGSGCGPTATFRTSGSPMISGSLAQRCGLGCDPQQRRPVKSCTQVSQASHPMGWTWRTWCSTTSTAPRAGASSQAPGTESALKRQMRCTAMRRLVDHVRAPTSMD